MRISPLGIACVLAALLGCSFSPPEGVLRCDPTTACPPSFVCRADHLCWRTDVDATAVDSGASDASHASDAFAIDGAGEDTGADAAGDGRVDAFLAETGPGDDAGTDAGEADGGCTITAETCNASDDDCDSRVDEGSLCGAGEYCIRGSCAPDGVVELATGSNHTCALMGSGAVWCFGDDTYGQLGDGASPATPVPTPTLATSLPSSRVIHLAIAGPVTCVVTEDSQVWCAGERFSGSIGDGDSSTADVPSPLFTHVVGLTDTVSSSGRCALDAAHTARCWGRGDRGALGDGTTPVARYAPSSPVAPSSGSLSFSDVQFHSESACGLEVGGAAYCWGYNSHHTVSPSLTVDAIYARPRAVGISGSRLASTAETACIVTGATVQCWGLDTYGQAGVDPATVATDGLTSFGTVMEAATDAPLDGSTVLQLGGSTVASCALLTSHEVVCWGDNSMGGSGAGPSAPTQDHRARPVMVDDGTNLDHVVQITHGGASHTCALRDDDHVLCWGNNVRAELGVDPASVPFALAAIDAGHFGGI
jgi:hypothetical protein